MNSKSTITSDPKHVGDSNASGGVDRYLGYMYVAPVALLAAFIIFSPHRLIYDENFHIGLTELIEADGWDELFGKNNRSAAGPLYPTMHLATEPITDLDAPAIRWDNFVCILITIACLAGTFRQVGVPAIRSWQLLAVPFLWPTVGMALTEVPALCAFSAFVLLAAIALTTDESRSGVVWSAAIGAGLALGAAILGRQTYLVVLPCFVVVAVWNPKHAATLVIMVLIAIASTIWLFWGWDGLVPPRLQVINAEAAGLVPVHAFLAMTYFGIAVLFIAPWKTLLPSVKVGAILAVVSFAIVLLLFRDDPPPARALLNKMLGQNLAWMVGLGIRTVMISAGLVWFWYTIRTGWERRNDPLYLLTVLMLLALVAAPAKISHLFSSRYVVGGVGLLLLQMSPPTRLNKWDLLRLALGSAIGAGTLWSYYDYWSKRPPKADQTVPPAAVVERIESIAASNSPIEPRSVTSAIPSSGVGSRLIITSRAPRSFATRGKSAAGVTRSDEPIANMMSLSRDHCVASIRTSCCSICPNEMVACFSRPPHCGHSGTQSCERNCATSGSIS
jgi:hypothetical protein